MRILLILLASVALLSACDSGDSGNAGTLSGPGVDVHCAALLPGQSGGVGDTTVKVSCPP